MPLIIRDPAIVRLERLSPVALERARRFLTFKDSGVQYMINTHKRNFRWKQSDPEGWDARHAELKEQLNRCILFQDEQGLYTYSGLADQLSQPLICGAPVERCVTLSEAKGMVWDHEPQHEPRYYQDEAVAALLKVGHGAIEIPTGSGKSRILLDLVHCLGLRTVIVAPSASILTQLVKDFRRYLGDRYVGQYGAGKKVFKKLVTIATYQSLTRLEPGDEAWEHLSKCEVFMVDESHTVPAGTLEKVCMGLAKNAAYRFFVSATQVRGDGTGLVLKGVTGAVVYTKTLRELVDQKFLARPHFKMIRVRSDDKFESLDVMKMTRRHLFYNPRVVERAADIANKAVRHLGHKVLIQVEEIGQFAHLLRHLEYEPRFAHGAAKSDPELKSKLPEKYWDSDPSELADQFNEEEFPLLVATSCLGMGTDLRVPETIVNLMGGCSPIGYPQAIGRGTRRHTFKNSRLKTGFNFFDFVPMLNTKSFNDRPDTADEKSDANPSPMYRHGLARAKMANDLYPDVRWE